MGLDYDPLWDQRNWLSPPVFIDRESSEANRGRKRRNFPSGAVFAAHGGNGAVRGISEPADKPISRIYDGYYRQLNFSV